MESQRSVGVVLVLPEPVGGEVTRIRTTLGDPRAQGMPAHITLLPPTLVGTGSLAELRAHLDRVARRHPALRITLAGTQTFRPLSEVVYLALEDGARSCAELGRAVCGGPVSSPSPFPFHPHVTLAHDLPASTLDAVQRGYVSFTASFSVAEMCLYQWDDHAGWAVDSRHQLVGCPEPAEG